MSQKMGNSLSLSHKCIYQKKGSIMNLLFYLFDMCQVHARLSSVPKGYSHIFNVSIQDERRVNDQLNDSDSVLLGVCYVS